MKEKRIGKKLTNMGNLAGKGRKEYEEKKETEQRYEEEKYATQR